MTALDLSIDSEDPNDGPATREQLVLLAVLQELLAEDAARAAGAPSSAREREQRRAARAGTQVTELRAPHVEGARRAVMTDDAADKRLILAQRHPKQLR